MADAATIRLAFERYCGRLTAHDASGIAALYAVDAVVEDPAGSTPVVGRAAIEAFYDGALGRVRPEKVELTGPVRVLATGIAAAATLRSTSLRDDHGSTYSRLARRNTGGAGDPPGRHLR